MNSLLGIPNDPTATQLSSATAITGGSLANLLSNRVGQVVRFGTGTVASNYIDIDFGAARTLSFVALLWSNLRSTDSISVLASTTAAHSGDVLNVAISPFYSSSKVTSVGTKSVATFTATSARYWRVRLDCATVHPDGFIQASRLTMGDKIDFAVDYSQLDLLDDDRGMVDRSDYGEDIEDQRRISFGWRVRWRFGSQAEMLATHQRMVMLGNTKPIVFCPIPSAANAQDLLAFGKLKSAAKSGSQVYDIWELSFDIYSEAA